METDQRKINIEISTNIILKILVVIFLVWFFYLIRNVLVILLFSFILVSILEPAVEWLKLKGMPKILSVLVIYLILAVFFALIIATIVPLIGNQIDQLSDSFPVYWEKISADFSNITNFLNQYGIYQSLRSIFQSINFSQAIKSVFSRLQDFAQAIVSLIIILVITFYLLVQENAIKRILRSVMPVKYLPYAYNVLRRIEKKLGLWLRAQLLLGLIIFIITFVAMLALGVKYALILALIAGLFELIPYLGPIFSGAIAVFITFFQSPFTALIILALFILIHPLENHIIVPQVMKKTVGLNPVISIVALLIGAELGGFIGVLLAMPLVTALSVFAQDLFEKKREEELSLEE